MSIHVNHILSSINVPFSPIFTHFPVRYMMLYSNQKAISYPKRNGDTPRSPCPMSPKERHIHGRLWCASGDRQGNRCPMDPWSGRISWVSLDVPYYTHTHIYIYYIIWYGTYIQRYVNIQMFQPIPFILLLLLWFCFKDKTFEYVWESVGYIQYDAHESKEKIYDMWRPKS